jgi:hypothetical protein
MSTAAVKGRGSTVRERLGRRTCCDPCDDGLRRPSPAPRHAGRSPLCPRCSLGALVLQPQALFGACSALFCGPEGRPMPSERCGIVIGPGEGAGPARLDYGLPLWKLRDASCSKIHANAHRDQGAREGAGALSPSAGLVMSEKRGERVRPASIHGPRRGSACRRFLATKLYRPWKVPSRASGATPQPLRLNLPPTSCTLSCAFNSTLAFESSEVCVCGDRNRSSSIISPRDTSSPHFGTPHHKSAAASILQRRA